MKLNWIRVSHNSNLWVDWLKGFLLDLNRVCEQYWATRSRIAYTAMRQRNLMTPYYRQKKAIMYSSQCLSQLFGQRK
jgi:hypothetical protein